MLDYCQTNEPMKIKFCGKHNEEANSFWRKSVFLWILDQGFFPAATRTQLLYSHSPAGSTLLGKGLRFLIASKYYYIQVKMKSQSMLIVKQTTAAATTTTTTHSSSSSSSSSSGSSSSGGGTTTTYSSSWPWQIVRLYKCIVPRHTMS